MDKQEIVPQQGTHYEEKDMGHKYIKAVQFPCKINAINTCSILLIQDSNSNLK